MRVVDQIENQVAAPEPRSVPDRFVMECLDAEAEGDGMLFAALWEDKLLYVEGADEWYIWGGHAWQLVTPGFALGLVRFVTERYVEAIAELERQIADLKVGEDKDERERVTERLIRKIGRLNAKISSLRKPTGRSACLEFARTFHDNPLRVVGKVFDQDPWLLGVQNGVVDLRTGVLTPGRPEQLVQRQCSCKYDPEIDTSDWQTFLGEIFNGNQELMDFVQVLFGYGATGFANERVFPFLLGPRASNGKSKFYKTIMRVMGTYAATVNYKVYMKNGTQQTADAPTPSIMKHEGLRMTFASELEEGCRFSSQMVKMLTGGDRLEGRDMYGGKPREFEPSHLSVLIGNHEPIPPVGDTGFWDRACLVYFPVRFVTENPDPERLERLADPDMDTKLAQMDGQVLAWLIEGAVKWHQAGRLIRPACVVKATKEYQNDSDWIGSFVEACCVKRPGEATRSSQLYHAFVAWYQENINSNKSATPSQRVWGIKFKDLFNRRHSREGNVYEDVALSETWVRRLIDEDQANSW